MPTVAKSSSKIAKLGDLSTFGVSSSAIPYDTSDSTGAIPTFTATFSGATDPEFLIGENLTVKTPSVGAYSGEIVNVGKAKGSGLTTLSADSILARLNSDLRAYPLADYGNGIEYTIIPTYSLEYWTQQCGVLFTAVPGDVLFYQSLFGHLGAFAKNVTRPLRSKRQVPVPGGTYGQMSLYGGRVYTGFGRGFEAKVDFSTTSASGADYLPVRIPPNGDKLVFGIDVRLSSTGNTGSVTWDLYDSKATTKTSVILGISADTGFTLQVGQNDATPATLLTVAVPKQKLYSVYISMSNSGANTTYTLTAVDEAGVVTTSTTTATSVLTGATKIRQLSYKGALGGIEDETYAANSFISVMPTAPVTRFPDQKVISPGYKGSAFMVGFSGNVWEHMKQFCSIYHLDVSYQNGQLVIGPRPKDITVGASLSELKTTINKREQARNVEVVNQNHKATGLIPTVMWSADSVYQVAVGETQEFTVQTEHSILEVSNPVCVSGINPFPYKVGAGQYVVTGSDGYIVSPTFWRDQGGSITAETTDVEGEIKITIKGPDYDSPRAPYRISEGDAGRPALYVSGTGVLSDPKTLKVATGNGKAAKDVGVTIDSPFIGNAKLAYDAAARASANFAAPEITVNIAEPLGYDEVSKLGTYPAGKLVKHDGNVFRVTSASQNYSSLSGEAGQHSTVYQVSRSFGDNATIAEVNAYYGDKTIGQVNIRPMKKVN